MRGCQARVFLEVHVTHTHPDNGVCWHIETEQLLPEQRGPAHNTSVGPLIFVMCELSCEGAVQKGWRLSDTDC